MISNGARVGNDYAYLGFNSSSSNNEALVTGSGSFWSNRIDLYVGNMWSSAGLRVTRNRQFAGVAPGRALRARFERHARGNSLYRNKGDGTFADVTAAAGTAMGRWAWSSDFVDLDNDGNLDLLVQNGYITGPDTGDTLVTTGAGT